MITFKNYETKEEIESWVHYVSIPKQGDLVEIRRVLYGVNAVVHKPNEVTVFIK